MKKHSSKQTSKAGNQLTGSSKADRASKTKPIPLSILLQDVEEHPFDTAKQRAERLNSETDAVRRALRKHNVPCKTPVGRPTSVVYDTCETLTEETATTFSQRLYIECRRMEVTQAKLARVLDLSTATVNSWFAGSTLPKYHALSLMLELGFDMVYLLGGSRTIQKPAQTQ